MFIPSLLFNIHWHLGDKGQGTVGSIDLGFLGGSPLSFGENSQSLPLAFFFSASFSRFSPSGTPITRMLDLSITSHVPAVLFCFLLHFQLGNVPCLSVFELTASVFSGCVQSSVNPIHEFRISNVMFFGHKMFA